jgi:uncharacterized protein
MTINFNAVKAHYEASDRKDIDGMMAPITSQTSWTEMAGFPYAGTYVGKDAILAGVFARIGEDWEGFSFTLERLLDAGNDVIGIGNYNGKCKSTNKNMIARVVHVWSMKDGKVEAFEQFADTALVNQAMT